MSAINETDTNEIEYTLKTKSNIKFRDMKGRPRWVRLEQRHADYEDHRATCELLGDEPMPKANQGHLSAAKLKGSPEYKEKMNKMTEKRERIKTHNTGHFETDVRSCGCNKHTTEYCFFCAVYGNEPELRWLTNPKKPKQRVRDMPCEPLTFTAPTNDWPSYRDILINAPKNEPEFWPRMGQVY